MQSWIIQNRSLILKEVISTITGMDEISPDFCQKMDLILCKMMYRVGFHKYASYDHGFVGRPYTYINHRSSESKFGL